MRSWVIVVIGIAACNKSVRENRRTCEEAQAKYERCIGELLGSEGKALLRGKDGVAACTHDDKTVAMYRACLPKEQCTEFLDCLENYALSTATGVSPNLPRREQCEQHVKEGLRGIAMQIAMLGEINPRTEDGKRRVQECVLDESNAWQDCVGPDERVEAQRYGAERQHECEAWSPELAACILKLPGAHDCKPDDYPLWRLPLVEGPGGPAVAWSLDVSDDDDYDDDVRLDWIGDRTLVIRDDTGTRAMRDGKVRWTAPAAGSDVDHVIAGGWLATRGTDDTRGIRLVDLATGARATALAGVYVDRVGVAAGGDRILALTSSYQLFEIAPKQCARTKTCARSLGVLSDDDAFSPRLLGGASHDSIVLASSERLLVADRRAKARLHLHYDINEVTLADDNVVVADDKGVAVLSLDGCSKLGEHVYLPSTRYTGGDRDLPEDCPDCVLARAGCIVAQHSVSWVSSVDPVALPAGGVAFNDHGIIEKTQHFGPRGRWEANTGGSGGVAGDEHFVYTVSLGLDGEGPVRLLALARETGKVIWQTELPNAPTTNTSIRVAVRNGMIAARVGTKVFVIELPRQA